MTKSADPDQLASSDASLPACDICKNCLDGVISAMAHKLCLVVK